MLNEKIKHWLREYASLRQSEFIENFFALQPQIQAYIKSKAHEEIGLTLSIKLHLEGGPELDTVAIGPMHFQVRVKDCDDAQSLSVRAELHIDEQSKINSILHRRDKAALESIVKQEIQSYFADAISLNAFWSELRNGGIKQGVINHLNAALRPIGRRVGYISLASDVKKDDVKPFFETDIEVRCKIKEYPQPVVIKNTVQMILQDVARYRANKSPRLPEWIKEKLPPVIQELLLDKNCTDLLLTFPMVEKNIKEILNREAETIGYSIKQLITVPDLEALNWLEPFTRKVQGDFETRLPRFNVNIQIAVTARIKDLRGIQSYVNRGQDVPRLMDEVIVEKAREFLHTVDPERFYIRFSSAGNEGDNTVEQELILRVSDALARLYNAEIISVTPKMGDTEITDRLRELQESVCQFDVEVFLADTEALVPVHFIGAFKVESVDEKGWHKFQRLKYDINKIKEYLEENIPAELDQYLKGGRSGRYEVDNLEQLIKNLAQDSIREVYGLAITVHSVRRRHNEIELAEREGRKYLFDQVNEADKNRINALLKQLQKAEDFLLEIIAEGGTDIEIKKQKLRIALIRRELPPGPASPRGKFKQPPASSISGRESLLGLSGTKRLAAGTQSQDGTKNDD